MTVQSIEAYRAELHSIKEKHEDLIKNTTGNTGEVRPERYKNNKEYLHDVFMTKLSHAKEIFHACQQEGVTFFTDKDKVKTLLYLFYYDDVVIDDVDAEYFACCVEDYEKELRHVYLYYEFKEFPRVHMNAVDTEEEFAEFCTTIDSILRTRHDAIEELRKDFSLTEITHQESRNVKLVVDDINELDLTLTRGQYSCQKRGTTLGYENKIMPLEDLFTLIGRIEDFTSDDGIKNIVRKYQKQQSQIREDFVDKIDFASQEVERAAAELEEMKGRRDFLQERYEESIVYVKSSHARRLVRRCMDAGPEFLTDMNNHRELLRALYYDDVAGLGAKNKDFLNRQVKNLEKLLRDIVPMYVFGQYPEIYVPRKASDEEIEENAVLLENILHARNRALHSIKDSTGDDNIYPLPDSDISVRTEKIASFAVRLNDDSSAVLLRSGGYFTQGVTLDTFSDTLKMIRKVCPGKSR